MVLPFDNQLAWQWATLMSVPGKPMDAGDAWIAATALRHAVPLVSHNRSHFEHVVGLHLITEA